MAKKATALSQVSGGIASFRWAFMPLGLFALIAVGVHTAADLVDDQFLAMVQALDAWADGIFGRFEWTQSWVDAIGSRQQTLIARAITLVWELTVDAYFAIPALGYDEAEKDTRLRFAVLAQQTWKDVLKRLNQKPTPMRVVRPLVTFVFAFAGAFAVSKLVESTLFVGLQGGVAGPDVAGPVARLFGGLAMLAVLFSMGWRAVLRALQYADLTCAEAATRAQPMALVGLVGNVAGLLLALPLVLEARATLSVFL
jgi:hypothetical protein